MLRASPLNILIYAPSPPSPSALSTRKTLNSGHTGLSPTALRNSQPVLPVRRPEDLLCARCVRRPAQGPPEHGSCLPSTWARRSARPLHERWRLEPRCLRVFTAMCLLGCSGTREGGILDVWQHPRWMSTKPRKAVSPHSCVYQILTKDPASSRPRSQGSEQDSKTSALTELAI